MASSVDEVAAAAGLEGSGQDEDIEVVEAAARGQSGVKRRCLHYHLKG
jgi:hypothetical protein